LIVAVRDFLSYSAHTNFISQYSLGFCVCPRAPFHAESFIWGRLNEENREAACERWKRRVIPRSSTAGISKNNQLSAVVFSTEINALIYTHSDIFQLHALDTERGGVQREIRSSAAAVLMMIKKDNNCP
jgi:hypothetical protein